MKGEESTIRGETTAGCGKEGAKGQGGERCEPHEDAGAKRMGKQ